MAEFKISANQLTQKKDELERLKKRFEKQINQLKSEAAKLDTMWEGEAKSKYKHSIEMDIQKLILFLQILAEFIAALVNIITAYRNAEKKNTQLASS